MNGEQTQPGPQYEVLRLIGRGAYGEVYLARDPAGTYCALKVVSRESFEEDRPFEREYEGLRKFQVVSNSYESQVKIFSVGRQQEPKQFFYAMELADDQDSGQNINPETYVPKTVRSELKRRGRLDLAECLSTGIVLAKALEHLHENGLIHRDIKPANIIFVGGRPKLADIGLVTDSEVSVSRVGTEGFVPPEGPNSPQADIYSLGKVLYEMSTGHGRLEFPELPTDLHQWPDRELLLELNAVVAKACAHDPRKRYRSAREMRDELLCVQRGASVRRRRVAKRRLVRTALVGSTLAAVVLLGLGVRQLRRGSASDKQAGQPGLLPLPPTVALEHSNLATVSPQHPAATMTPPLRARYLVTVTDDFVVDLYHNGLKVPDSERYELQQVYGATAEKVQLEVRKGDWLVFNVVNNRFRWQGSYYFAAAGMLGENRFGFVTDLSSGDWSVCDDPGQAPQFIAVRNFLRANKPAPVSRPWQEGPKLMRKFAGPDWQGEPLWGTNRNTWIKIIVK
jgi:serine/threonine protein kinase